MASTQVVVRGFSALRRSEALPVAVEPRRTGRVQIRAGDQLVELSWATARELKARLLTAGAASLVDQFNRVGTSRPVVLDHVDRRPLLEAVLGWIGRSDDEHVPDRLLALRAALVEK